MHISELKLQNFKKFTNAKFVFSKGINVIKGANEQGKSTLLEALIVGLFVDPSSSKYREKTKSWNSDRYPNIEVDYFADEKLYSIVKDFDTKQVEFTDVIDQRKEKDMLAVSRALKEHIGVSNEALLRSTACVNHDQMALIEEGKKSLEEALQEASLHQEKVSIVDLIRNLGAKIDQMQVGMYRPAKNNGIIKTLTDEVNEKREELRTLKEKENGYESASEKLNSLLKEQKEVDAQIEKYSKIVADFEKSESIKKEIALCDETIKGSSADTGRVREFNEKLELLKKKIEALGGENLIGILDSKQESISSLNKQIQSKQEEINLLITNKPLPKPKKKPVNVQLIGVVLLSILFVAFGVVMQLLPMIFAGLGIGIIGIVLVYLLKKETGVDVDEVHNYGMQNAQRELEELRAQLNAILSECQVNTTEEFYSKRTQMIAAHSDYIQTKSTMDAIMRGRNFDEIQRAMDEAIQKKRELELQLPEEVTVPKEQYMKDKRELELLNLDKKDIINEIAEEKAKVKVADVTPQMIAEKEDRLQKIEKQLNEETHKLEVLQIIFDSLSKAKEEISSNVSTNIQKYAESTLPKLTNGRYTSIRVDNNFKIEVFSKEKNNWLRPDDHLSRGTIDQIYLSARLALADVLTGGKPIPLFFDDPFVSFDANRRNSLVQELLQISQNHQVFIFTCHDFFDDIGTVVNVEES